MPKRKKSWYLDLPILWKSDVIQCTPSETIELQIVDCHPHSPTLWIDKYNGRLTHRTTMQLKDLREIKLIIEAAETTLTRLTEQYEATKPPILKHAFYLKCLLCFADLEKTESEYHEHSVCDNCSTHLLVSCLNEKWHELWHGCKSKAEVVAKLENDILFRAEFTKFRNQILRVWGLSPQ